LHEDEAAAGKDIELVLVTGAGATAEFGHHGAKVPMMAEWSDSLAEEIGKASRSYASATGLVKGLTGPEFEERLDHFLDQARAFSLIGGILAPSIGFQPTALPLAEQELSQWHTRTTAHLSRITDLIRESLRDNFSAERIDLKAASTSYARLLQDLHVGNTDSLVYATTNYDPAGEYAIERLGGIPDWGAPRWVCDPGFPSLRADRIIDGLPRYVPVLHLRGRVDWYGSQADGTPCDTGPVIRSLWEQFDQALRRARRVFVLGHSLNDRTLVRSLRRNVSPPQRLAVGLLARKDDPGHADQSAASTMNVLRDCLPAAGMITVRFGPDPIISAHGVRTWTERIGEATGQAARR
jgi:hypothetical protein